MALKKYKLMYSTESKRSFEIFYILNRKDLLYNDLDYNQIEKLEKKDYIRKEDKNYIYNCKRSTSVKFSASFDIKMFNSEDPVIRRMIWTLLKSKMKEQKNK